ncbi:MAG TPA: CDGSH iron-sulfur domain-containing protein [Geobacteraceae bacterium]
MNQITIAPNKPIVLDLEPGTYYRCTCGKSATMPFCDGAHLGSDRAPIAFEVKEKQQVYLCNCGKTANAPYCDGSCQKA